MKVTDADIKRCMRGILPLSVDEKMKKKTLAGAFWINVWV